MKMGLGAENTDIGLDVKGIRKIISDCSNYGENVVMSDIAYTFLLHVFKDKEVPYGILFGTKVSQEKVSEYNTSRKIRFLKKYIDRNFFSTVTEEKKDSKKYADISFEENKDAMIRMIDELKSALDEGRIEYKEYSDRVTKLRIALNDKFYVSEKQDEQRVVVNIKYNDICPYCKHEIRRKTDEDMLAEIKEKYILTPKHTYKDNGDE